MSSIKDIGKILKNTREKKGLTVDKVYKKTHIHPGIIKALEEGDTKNMVSKVYAKAFLKKYAVFLELDQDAIGSDFIKAFPEEPSVKLFLDSEEDEIPFDIMGYITIFVSIVSVVLVMIFSYRSILTPLSKLRAYFFGESQIKIAPVQKKEGTSEKKSAQEEKPVEKKPVAKPVPIQPSFIITVTSSDRVWMRINKDDELVFAGILPKGEKQTWECNKNIELRVGKLEALEFTINKKYFGIIGTGVENVVVNKEGIRVGSKTPALKLPPL